MQYLSVIPCPDMIMSHVNGNVDFKWKNYLHLVPHMLTIYPERLRATDFLLSICHIIILNGYRYATKKNVKYAYIITYWWIFNMFNLFAIKLFIKIEMTKTFVLFS